MKRTITLSIILILGLFFFFFGLKGIKKKSFTHNILEAIFDLFTGAFQFSDIGALLLGLLLIIIGIFGLVFGWGTVP